jgi:hypothetical protein
MTHRLALASIPLIVALSALSACNKSPPQETAAPATMPAPVDSPAPQASPAMDDDARRAPTDGDRRPSDQPRDDQVQGDRGGYQGQNQGYGRGPSQGPYGPRYPQGQPYPQAAPYGSDGQPRRQPPNNYPQGPDPQANGAQPYGGPH